MATADSKRDKRKDDRKDTGHGDGGKKKEEREKEAAERTLFVRNIGWDTTEDDFKEHMEQFGPVDYAVLCKAAIRDVTQPEDAPAKTGKKPD